MMRIAETEKADMTVMRTPSPEAGMLMEEASRLLVSSGVSKSAGVFSKDVIAHMAAERRADAAQMEKQAFSNIPEAEHWLDS